jgi:predicted Zn finger-like uncharacterized protein
MAIRTRCPGCQTVYSLADHLAGKTVRCKKCESAIVVSAAKESAEDEGDESKSRGAVGEREKIQTRPSASKRPPGPTVAEPRRPRRRDRDDEEDDEELEIRRPRRVSNRGLVIGLIAGCAGLLLLLAGGTLLLVLLFANRSGTKTADLLAGGDGPWPEVGPLPLTENAVVLHIAGVVDEPTREAISDKLQALALEAGNFNMSSRSHGDRMTVVLMPVQNVQALSQELDFGTVDNVNGRIITMTARKAEGPPPNADVVTKALHQLKSPSRHKRQEAVRNLKDMLPDEKRRADVVMALEPLLNDSDLFTRKFAIEALGVWGNKDALPLLLNAMREKDNRGEAIKALGRLKDERAAEPIAERLEEFFDRHEAEEALKRMGPIAEKAVLTRLNHHDWQVRMTVCDILGAIGTKQSIPPLEKVVEAGKDPFSGQNHLVAKKAEQAIRAIKARQ